MALAGTPIALPPPPAPPKRDVLLLNGRARHARFMRHRAALALSYYQLRTTVQFQPAAVLHPAAGAPPVPETNPAGPGAARATTAPCSVAEPAPVPDDLTIPEFLRRAGVSADGWASHKKASAR